MRLVSSKLVALSALALVAAGCSGGQSGGARISTADCNSTSTFCLTSCNLGCTVGGSCAVDSIAQNQLIEMMFSQMIDPSTVNPATISLKTAAGESPSGSFEVDGQRIRFVPEVRLVAGVTSFGFRSGEEYFLTLPGGANERLSVRSTSGDALARTVSCSLSIDGGLVDLNDRAPTAILVSPTSERDVGSNPLIIVEFDELIDVAPFQGGTTQSSPIQYLLRRVDPISGEPDVSQSPILIPGVPQAEVVVGVNPRSRVLLQPLIPLPNSVAVDVVITDQVRDISGTPANTQLFRFYTSIGQPELRFVNEAFAQTEKFDASVSSGGWGGGTARPGTIGGSGKHGAFDLSLFPQVGGEFVWDTDQPLSIPTNSTLLRDREYVITDGQLELSTFRLASGQVLRLRGSIPPTIRVSGSMEIAGSIVASGGNAPTVGVDNSPFGGEGGTGGPGGGSGGRGADSWNPPAVPPFPAPTAANAGRDGQSLQAPATSGYAGNVAATRGRGAPWFPTSGLLSDVNANLTGTYSSQQITGGGGGGYLTAGSPGVITIPMENPPIAAPAAAGGSATTFRLPPTGVDPLEHFLLGGSGGGGGGSVSSSIRRGLPANFQAWTNGFGGGGGGGAFALRVGRNLLVDPAGMLVSRGGGTGTSTGNSFSRRGTSAAGGGSGGSILLQAAGSVTQSGTIDLQGGAGGLHVTATITGVSGIPGESRGGAGAPGYVRVETAGASLGSLGNVVGPTLSSIHFGPLVGRDAESIAMSRWYALNSLLPPRLLRYELRVRIDGVDQLFTDDPTNPRLANVLGAPVRLKLQGADLDVTSLEPRGETGVWVDTVSELSLSQPTGFRFVLLFDTTTTVDVVVESFDLFYEA